MPFFSFKCADNNGITHAVTIFQKYTDPNYGLVACVHNGNTLFLHTLKNEDLEKFSDLMNGKKVEYYGSYIAIQSHKQV